MTSRRNRSNRSERDRARLFSLGVGLLSFACVGGVLSDAETSVAVAQVPQGASRPTTGARGQGQVVFFSIPIAADAPVFAGPNDAAYRTGTIAKGRFVEVYFRTPDGWCAVRPPQGSFSWVNAKFVVADAEPFGRIVAADGKAIPARVGAGTVEESAIVQVGLKNGQKVKIVDRAVLPNGSAWVKILPPPGEFRWIRETSLTPDPALAQLPTKLTFQNEFLAAFAETDSAKSASPIDSTDSTYSTSSTDSAYSTYSTDFARPNDLRTSSDDGTLTLELPPTDEGAADFANAVEPLDAATFRAEAARLNGDVFQATRQEQISDAELARLSARAETLFEAAPSDDDRIFVQSIYDAIKIVERRRSEPPRLARADVGYNGEATNVGYAGYVDAVNSANGGIQTNFNGFQAGFNGSSNGLPANVPANGGVYADSANFAGANGEPLALDGSNGFFPQEGGVYQTTPDGRLVPFDPSGSNGFNGANGEFAPTSTVETPSPANGSTSKSRLSFAFSGVNNPFGSSKSKNVRVATGSAQKSGTTGGSSKLPSLFPSRERLIVPPPNYRSTPLGDASARQNGKLVAAGARRKAEREEAARIAQATKSAQTTKEPEAAKATANAQTAQIAKATELARSAQASETATTAQVAQAAEGGAIWRAVDGAPGSESRAESAPRTDVASTSSSPSNPNPVVPTSATTPKTPTPERAKIRQANSFAPIAIESSNVFDASGTLAYLPNAPEGTPKYALVRPSGKKFDVVSYLEADEGVPLKKYVGKKIGVQGTTGTIQINETTKNLTIVRAVFPI